MEKYVLNNTLYLTDYNLMKCSNFELLANTYKVFEFYDTSYLLFTGVTLHNSVYCLPTDGIDAFYLYVLPTKWGLKVHNY